MRIRPLFGGRNDEEVKIYEAADRVCLRQAEGGASVRDVCRKLGVSEQAFYLWKKKFARMGVAEVRRLEHPTSGIRK